MNKLLISFVILTLSFGSFASGDDLADIFHERIEQRYQTVNFEEFRLISENEVPTQVQELRDGSLGELLAFATAYDLFRLGWSYENDKKVYQVTVEGGEIVAYTFSAVIIKDGVPRSRRFYQASKRVDGIFFVERISDYDL